MLALDILVNTGSLNISWLVDADEIILIYFNLKQRVEDLL